MNWHGYLKRYLKSHGYQKGKSPTGTYARLQRAAAKAWHKKNNNIPMSGGNRETERAAERETQRLVARAKRESERLTQKSKKLALASNPFPVFEADPDLLAQLAKLQAQQPRKSSPTDLPALFEQVTGQKYPQPRNSSPTNQELLAQLAQLHVQQPSNSSPTDQDLLLAQLQAQLLAQQQQAQKRS